MGYGAGMKISVVIPAFNEEKLLAGTLESIQAAAGAFRRRGWECEVVVCDNHSTDRTGEIARAGGARVVFEPVNQIGRARNTGAAAATGDWLLFVDADSRPGEALFDAVAVQIQSGRCLAGGSTVKLDDDRLATTLFTGLWNLTSRWLRWMAGSFIFVEKSVFEQAGGFDTRFYAAEELELSRRLKRLARAGRKTIVILHRHPLPTSARKLRLYSARELGGFFLRSLVSHRRAVSSPESAYLWYDGRR